LDVIDWLFSLFEDVVVVVVVVGGGGGGRSVSFSLGVSVCCLVVFTLVSLAFKNSYCCSERHVVNVQPTIELLLPVANHPS